MAVHLLCTVFFSSNQLKPLAFNLKCTNIRHQTRENHYEYASDYILNSDVQNILLFIRINGSNALFRTSLSWYNVSDDEKWSREKKGSKRKKI